MTDHLSVLQLKKFCVSALPEDELAAAAAHTANCQSCHQRLIEELKRQHGPVPLNFTLEPEFWFRNDHVDFDLLVALADKSLDRETEEIIIIHSKTCEMCREDIRSFLAARAATTREMEISYGRPEHQLIQAQGTVSWWQRLQPRPVYAVAALVLLACLLLIGLFALNRRPSALEANKQDQINPRREGSPNNPPSLATASSSPLTSNDLAKVVLKDHGGEVTIDENGRVTGLDEASEKSRVYIARAALAERIEPAEVLRRLSGEPGDLRGTDNGRQEFRLLYPVRKIVIEDRPVFRWESLPGVSNYRVYVLDAEGKQFAQSEDLPPTQTHWKPRTALHRGQIFSWVVTAVVDGKKIVSPSASDPEVKFAVLSNPDFKELASLRKFDSHLALGVFYARAGLLNEAQREFESLIKLNPDSELPRKLLHSVRSMKREN